MWDLTRNRESKIFSVLVLAYWSFFWLLNFVDKIIVGPANLWNGKDRVTQFSDYFASINIHSDLLVWLLIGVITILEFAAFLLVAAALVNLVRNRSDVARSFFFWGTAAGMVIFTSFSVGDQIFGDRPELWEHGAFLLLIMVSWFAYRFYNPEDKSVPANAGEVETQSKANTDELLYR